MIMVSDKELRQAIVAVIEEALKDLYNIPQNEALHVRLHDHWVLSFSVNETANMLKVNKEGHPEKGKIHGWMVGIDAIQRFRPEPTNTMEGNFRLKNTNPNRRDILHSYKVWCYHALEEGVIGQESETNSENILTAELEAVCNAFSNHPTLGLTDSSVLGHTELQFKKVDTLKFGESQANVAQGVLEVRLRRAIRPQE